MGTMVCAAAHGRECVGDRHQGARATCPYLSSALFPSDEEGEVSPSEYYCHAVVRNGEVLGNDPARRRDGRCPFGSSPIFIAASTEEQNEVPHVA